LHTLLPHILIFVLSALICAAIRNFRRRKRFILITSLAVVVAGIIFLPFLPHEYNVGDDVQIEAFYVNGDRAELFGNNWIHTDAPPELQDALRELISGIRVRRGVTRDNYKANSWVDSHVILIYTYDSYNTAEGVSNAIRDSFQLIYSHTTAQPENTFARIANHTKGSRYYEILDPDAFAARLEAFFAAYEAYITTAEAHSQP